MGSSRKIKQSQAKGKKRRGQAIERKKKRIPEIKKILRRRGVARSRKRASFFFLKRPSMKKAISLIAGITVAKATK